MHHACGLGRLTAHALRVHARDCGRVGPVARCCALLRAVVRTVACCCALRAPRFTLYLFLSIKVDFGARKGSVGPGQHGNGERDSNRRKE